MVRAGTSARAKRERQARGSNERGKHEGQARGTSAKVKRERETSARVRREGVQCERKGGVYQVVTVRKNSSARDKRESQARGSNARDKHEGQARGSSARVKRERESSARVRREGILCERTRGVYQVVTV